MPRASREEQVDGSSGALTSFELLERAHWRLMRAARDAGESLALAELLALWHAAGEEAARQLLGRRGVRFPALGTFVMTKAGSPSFVLDPQFITRFGALAAEVGKRRREFRSTTFRSFLAALAANTCVLPRSRRSDAKREMCGIS